MFENNDQTEAQRLSRREIIQGVCAAAGSIAVLTLLLFGLAGTWNWWQAWTHVALWILYMAVGTPLILKFAPDLFKRRANFGPGAEKNPEQKTIATALFVSLIGLYAVIGLDQRFGWTSVPMAVVVAGIALVVVGMILVVMASLYNHFLAATITVERGQPVISTGPYAWVRHPMYSGVLVWFGAAPLALGSWWALIFIALMASVLYFRIRGEERHLLAQLPGYEDYCRKVRWRLIPYIL